MTADDTTHLTGDGMDDAEIAAFLTEHGFGVLSLTDGQEAYGVPLSFGYDGADTLYFVFLPIGAESKKATFAERTARASLTVVDVDSKHVWTSVVATGPLRTVGDDEWDSLLAAVEDNAWYSSAFSEAVPTDDLTGWALDIDAVTGRRSLG